MIFRNEKKTQAKGKRPCDTTPAPTTSNSLDQDESSDTILKKDHFPILSLPLEIRLKIYSYILPPRHHKIVTSIPPTNFFYNASPPHQNSYPFGHIAPLGPSGLPLSVPYKVLTKNTHISHPHASITTSLLRTCRQIHTEAEPVLYSSRDTVWDFGVHLEALRGFWGERSVVARHSVRSLKIAFEVPLLEREQRPGRFKIEKKWRECQWAEDLLSLPSLQHTKITCWSAVPPKIEDAGLIGVTVPRFDSWVAGRMVSDAVLREKMVKDGVVVREEVVVLGSTANWVRSGSTGLDGV